MKSIARVVIAKYGISLLWRSETLVILRMIMEEKVLITEFQFYSDMIFLVTTSKIGLRYMSLSIFPSFLQTAASPSASNGPPPNCSAFPVPFN
jgi:hypothetical protein